jgi:hypothetical protein
MNFQQAFKELMFATNDYITWIGQESDKDGNCICKLDDAPLICGHIKDLSGEWIYG